MSVRLTSLALLAVIIYCNDIVLSAPLETIPSLTTTKSSRCQSLTIETKYPLTNVEKLPNNGSKYAMGIITDLDKESKDTKNAYTWHSYLKRGWLTYFLGLNPTVIVEWDPNPANETEFTSHLSSDGRSMELSELITYNGNLLTIDDKTGIIYKIKGNKLQSWVILMSGDGNGVKEMKCEWATVKDSKLIVGSHGTETVKNGQSNYDNMWVKIVDKDGVVENEDWVNNFKAIRQAMNIDPSGYVTHEACVWSEHQKKWFFLPRKASNHTYHTDDDGTKGTNALVIASEDFKNIKVVYIGKVIPERGFSSFKFVPGTLDTVIAAIKTKEVNGTTATFITVFTVKGLIIYPETLVSDKKFEGLEFI